MHLKVGEGLAWVHLVSGPCLERQSLWCPLGTVMPLGAAVGVWALTKPHAFRKRPNLGSKEHWFALNFELLGFSVTIMCQVYW